MYAVGHITAAFLTCLFAFYKFYSSSRKERYPPGPAPHFLVGNTFQVPTIKTWKYFEKLAKEYGPILRLSLAGDDIIVLSNPKDAEELLGNRSQNYSSRRPLIYAGKHQSNNKRLVLLAYGDKLKKHRAVFHQMLQPRAVGGYDAIQELESIKFLSDIIARPQDLTRHCTRFAASLVFTLSYGGRLADDDKDLNAVMEILNGFVQDTYPGAHLVDTFPILDSLPDLLAPWRLEARRKHDKEMKLYNRLVSDVKAQMDGDDVGPECFAARLWDQQKKSGLDLEELSYVAGSAFEAGTDTTTGTILWFIMAMVLYPETMKRAQAEIDTVVGVDGKLAPTFMHMNDLPYCIALTKEVFRWAPPAPGGFPHYSDRDDEYKGYKINAKTMVIPCIWTMHRDEAEFPDSNVFNPDRFLRKGCFTEHDSLTEGHYAFGFGRRKCPGQYLGAKTIWIGLTRLLWAFDILPGLDVHGKPIPVDPDNCTSGMTSRPLDFPVRVVPRSKDHVETILGNTQCSLASAT